MPAPLQLAYNGVSPAVLSTWPGGVGALNVPIPLRGGGAPNMSGIKLGSVANRIKMFSTQKNMFNGPNITKRRATTQGPSAQGTEPQGQEPQGQEPQGQEPQGILPPEENTNRGYFSFYMKHPNLLKTDASNTASAVGGARKHRRRPTRKSRRVQRKSRRVQRKSRRLTRRR